MIDNFYFNIIYDSIDTKQIKISEQTWIKIINEAKKEGILLENNDKGWSVPFGILAMLLGCVLIYSCMFATGYWIYGDYNYALPLTIIAIISGVLLMKTWSKIRAIIL